MPYHEDNLFNEDNDLFLDSFEEDQKMDIMLQVVKDFPGSEEEDRLTPESDEMDEEQYQVNFAHG